MLGIPRRTRGGRFISSSPHSRSTKSVADTKLVSCFATHNLAKCRRFLRGSLRYVPSSPLGIGYTKKGGMTHCPPHIAFSAHNKTPSYHPIAHPQQTASTIPPTFRLERCKPAAVILWGVAALFWRVDFLNRSLNNPGKSSHGRLL